MNENHDEKGKFSSGGNAGAGMKTAAGAPVKQPTAPHEAHPKEGGPDKKPFGDARKTEAGKKLTEYVKRPSQKNMGPASKITKHSGHAIDVHSTKSVRAAESRMNTSNDPTKWNT